MDLDFLTHTPFWIALGQIIIIDILLGGDNAVVIALACRKLPPEQRRKGIIYGTAGAIILRIILIAFAMVLLQLAHESPLGCFRYFEIHWTHSGSYLCRTRSPMSRRASEGIGDAEPFH